MLVKKPCRQTGFALILVLWVLSLMIIMAGSFALSMRREAGIVANIKNSAQAIAIAESGLNFAEMMLLLPDKNKRWRTDGSVYQLDTDDAVIRIRLLAESGKIDINKAEEKLLTSLLAAAPSVDSKTQVKLVSAILDWRDEDDLVHIDGAEQKEYKEAGLKYSPRNKPFQSIEELRLVLGMDEATFNWLAPLVTVHSRQAQVNLQQASKDVLLVLPELDEGLLEEYLAARLDSAKRDLPPPFPSIPVSTQPNQSPQPAQGGQAQAITVISEALLEDGTAAGLAAMIQNGPGTLTPFQILNWQRNAVNGTSLFADQQTGTSAENDLIVKYYAESEFNH